MRNALVALALLAFAVFAWLALDRPPDWVAEDEAADLRVASTESTPDPTLPVTMTPLGSGADGSPGDDPEDPEFAAKRAARDARLQEIREDAERRAREREDDSQRSEDRGRSPLIGGGGGGGGRSDTSPGETLPFQDQEEPATAEETDAPLNALIALENEAVRLAQEIDLVPESRLEGLSENERRAVIADSWVWHTYLVRKFGPDYTVAQENKASAAASAFSNPTPEDRLSRLQDAL